MTNFPPKPADMSLEFYEACLAVASKRPRTVIHHILQYGSITTEELSERYGYDHPPRAVRDVRENGIPLDTFKVTSQKTGRKIAAYRFANPSQMIAGRLGGRKAFSKKFKDALIARYGARSTLSGEPLEPRYLQIDHRIPYEVAGNEAADNVEHYMLLDASAQRAKSWSCENCDNLRTIRDPSICGGCFWAYPENYRHVAMRQERRLDITWSDAEISTYEALGREAEYRQISMQVLIKEIIAGFLGRFK